MAKKKILKVKKHEKRSFKYYVGEGVRKCIMIGALFTFSYVAYNLTNIYLDYADAKDAYASVNSVLGNDSTGDSDDDSEGGSSMHNNNEGNAWSWDFDSYLKFNSDTKGFIHCKDTSIQYPIMQTSDNDYYLHHLANNIVSDNGAIYIDYKIDQGLEAKNCVIYGHNMMDGSMFGSLPRYQDEGYYEMHPEMDIYVGYKHYRYEVFSVFTTPVDGPVYTIRFPSDKNFKRYIKTCQEASIYPINVGEITTEDKIVTLSTCVNSGDERYRFVVQLVRREEITE